VQWLGGEGIWVLPDCLPLATVLRTPMNTGVLGQYILYEDGVASSRVHSLGDVGRSVGGCS